jgi:hypothetical protein
MMNPPERAIAKRGSLLPYVVSAAIVYHLMRQFAYALEERTAAFLLCSREEGQKFIA